MKTGQGAGESYRIRATKATLSVQQGPLMVPGTKISHPAEFIDSMPSFVTVAKVGSIPEGKGATFPLGDTLVAVFNRSGTYYAINDLCPHMGASLGAGELNEEGIVTCPWHAWHFDVCDGTWCDNPRLRIDSFPVRVERDEIQVQLPSGEGEDSCSHDEKAN